MTAFDAKADVGIMLGYSSVSKAYRVFNKRTLTIEESTHVVFDEPVESFQIKLMNFLIDWKQLIFSLMMKKKFKTIEHLIFS